MLFQQQHQGLGSGQHQRAVGQKRNHDVRIDAPRKGYGLRACSGFNPDGGQSAGQGDQAQMPSRLEHGPGQDQRIDQQGGQRHGIEEGKREAFSSPGRVEQDPRMQYAARCPSYGRGVAAHFARQDAR